MRTRRHYALAVLFGLGLRIFFVLRFPTDAGDTAIYEELARNWVDHGVYGLFLGGQLTPVDLRVPGYPAFLASIYLLFGRTRLAVMLAQAALDLVTCFLAAALAARLVPQPLRRRVAIAALWLAATCPFVANYAAVPLTEVLATFLTTAALSCFVAACVGSEEFDLSVRGFHFVLNLWALGALFVGLGTLVRPETPLVLLTVGLVCGWRWRRPAHWGKFARTGLLMAAGLVLPLLPWAARNWRALDRVQFLAPRYAVLPGEHAPRGFYAWTQTWLVRFRDVYLAPWKIEEEPIRIADLPAAAFDSAEERARVAVSLEQYNVTLDLSPDVDGEFAALARERTARHPLRTYLWVPLGRVATLWFTPRIELLPYSGHLWPPGEKWEEDPADFSVTVGFGALNFLYVGLALAGAWRAARRRGQEDSPSRWALAMIAAFIVVRTAFLTQIETPEPRYLLVCFPAVLALGALVWEKDDA